MRSIQSRLTSGLVISLIILLIVQWWLIGTSVRYLSQAYIASRLEHDAQSLISALAIDPNTQTIFIEQQRIDRIYKTPFSGHYYKLKVYAKSNNIAPQVLRSRSLWDTDIPVLEQQHGQSNLTRAAGPQKQQLLLLQTTYKKRGLLAHISVAEDLTAVFADIKTFQIQHAIISAIVLSLLVALQIYIIRKSLNPLEAIRRELENLEKGIVSQLNESVPTEVSPLVKELNHQLASLKKRLERSRNATGNLAHALKTPLTLIDQLANSPELEQLPQLKQKLLENAMSIRLSVDRELKRARVAGSYIGGGQTQLLPEIESLVKTLTAIYSSKSLQFDVRIPEKTVCTIDRQDLLEVLGNLLDNACKWAKHSIKICVPQNGNTRIIIEDDGPGCDPLEMNSLLQRGIRADERVSGHGLGLSIVAEIIEEYGGKLEFSSSSDLGGLKVSVHFPHK